MVRLFPLQNEISGVTTKAKNHPRFALKLKQLGQPKRSPQHDTHTLIPITPNSHTITNDTSIATQISQTPSAPTLIQKAQELLPPGPPHPYHPHTHNPRSRHLTHRRPKPRLVRMAASCRTPPVTRTPNTTSTKIHFLSTAVLASFDSGFGAR